MALLGFDIQRIRETEDDRETGEISISIDGISKNVCDSLSTRTKQINEAVANGTSVDKAKITTRKNKSSELTTTQLIQKTKQTIDCLRQDGSVKWRDINELRNNHVQDIEPKSNSEIMEELHATESKFREQDFLRLKLREAHISETADNVLEEARFDFASMKRNGEILALGNGNFCTARQAQTEHECVANALEMSKSKRHHLPRESVETALMQHEKEQGFTLSEEQRKTVFHLACESGDVALLVGDAGTGKTATAGAYIKAFEACGYTVHGTSTSQLATEKLEVEAKAKSLNTQKLISDLKNGKIKLDDKSVLILDEAGMVASKEWNQIQKHVERAGAKLIAVGDDKQLQPVGAGSPFRTLIEKDGFEYARISEIRRQKTESGREVAKELYDLGKTGNEIIARLKDQGQVSANSSTHQEAIKALAWDYVNDEKKDTKKLIIAPKRNDCEAINNAVRSLKKSRGELGEGVIIQNGDNKEREYANDDKIIFSKNSKKLGIANGDSGKIQSIEKLKNGFKVSVKIDSEIEEKNGKIVSFHTKEFSSFKHAYATTVHKSQGQGVDNVYMFARPSDRSMMMVGYTRHKEKFQLYCQKKDLGKISDSINAWGKKPTVEEMLNQQPKKNISDISSKHITKEIITSQKIAHVEQLAERKAKNAISTNSNRLKSEIEKYNTRCYDYEANHAELKSTKEMRDLLAQDKATESKSLSRKTHEYAQLRFYETGKKNQKQVEIEAVKATLKEIDSGLDGYSKHIKELEKWIGQNAGKYQLNKNARKDKTEELERLKNSGKAIHKKSRNIVAEAIYQGQEKQFDADNKRLHGDGATFTTTMGITSPGQWIQKRLEQRQIERERQARHKAVPFGQDRRNDQRALQSAMDDIYGPDLDVNPIGQAPKTQHKHRGMSR